MNENIAKRLRQQLNDWNDFTKPPTIEQSRRTSMLCDEIDATMNDIKIAQQPNNSHQNNQNMEKLNETLLTKIHTFTEAKKRINEIYQTKENQQTPPEIETNETTKPDDTTKTDNPTSPRKLAEKRKKIYECTICQKTLSQPHSLKRHTKTIHGDDRPKYQGMKPRNCTPCQKNFPTPYLLKRHIQATHSGRPHICSLCQKDFSIPYLLKRHIKAVHSEEQTQNNIPKKRSHKCNLCYRKFTEPFSLTRHKRKMHETPSLPLPEDKSYHPADGRECYVCRKLFISTTEFAKHNSKQHKNQTEFQCKLCGLKYKRNGHLTRHLDDMHWRQHDTPINTHYRHCIMCRITFNDEHDLRDHTKEKHRNQSSFQCGICNNSYKKHHYLKRHAQTHHPLDTEQTNKTCTPVKQNPNTPAQTPKAVPHTPNNLLNQNNQSKTPPQQAKETPAQHRNPQPINPTITDNDDIQILPTITQFATPAITPTNQNTTKLTKEIPKTIQCLICPKTAKNHKDQNSLNIHQMTEHPNLFANKTLHETLNKYSTIIPTDNTKNQTPQTTPLPQPTKNIPIQKPTINLNACLICQFTTTTTEHLYYHIQNNHTNFFNLYRPLATRHMQSHFYKCALCNATAYQLRGLNNHIKNHQKSKKTSNLWQFICPNKSCGTTTQTIDHMALHINTCQHKTTIRQNVQQIYKQPIIPLYKCTICNATFQKDEQILDHIEQQHHSQETQIFKNNQSKLRTISPYKCKCCNRKFIDLLSLEQHQIRQETTQGNQNNYQSEK